MNKNHVRIFCVTIVLILYCTLNGATKMGHKIPQEFPEQEIPAIFIQQHAQLLKELKTRLKLRARAVPPAKKAGTQTSNANKNLVQISTANKAPIHSLISNETALQTPTAAYLSIPHLKAQAYTAFEIDIHPIRQKIVEKVIVREKEHADEYYPFYHGQKFEFRLLQDTVKELLELINLRDVIKSFAFLRLPHENKYPATSANTFLNLQQTTHGLNWNDSMHGLHERLLSVNLSLFGSTSHRSTGECTFDFFLSSVNYLAPPIKQLLESFFNHYSFSTTSFIAELINLYEKYRTVEGNLLQIFIPKGKVDECAYLSRDYGIPYSERIVPGCFNGQLGRHTRIAPILEKYAKDPTSIAQLDSLQARLVMCSDTFLNPDSGIKIYRYTTMNKATQKQYQSELKALVKRLLIDYIEKQKIFFKSHPQNGLAQCQKRRLCELIKLIALPNLVKLMADAPVKLPTVPAIEKKLLKKPHQSSTGLPKTVSKASHSAKPAHLSKPTSIGKVAPTYKPGPATKQTGITKTIASSKPVANPKPVTKPVTHKANPKPLIPTKFS